PGPGPEIAKSISSSSLKCSICSWVISPSAAWRTVSGLKTCLLTGNILPSILILIGALEVKNRSDALRSTISLNSGLVLTCGACSAPVISSGSAAMLELVALAFDFFRDAEVAIGLDRLVLALALQLHAQPQLILRIRITQRIFVRNMALLVQVEQRLVEGLHAHAGRARHDFLDLGDFAAEDQVLDQGRIEHDLHR